MVRNYGNDGTGDHSKRLNSDQNNHYLMQPISEETHFEFTDDVFTYEPIYLERHHYTTTFMPYTWLRRIYKKSSLKPIYFFLGILITYQNKISIDAISIIHICCITTVSQ